MISLAVFASGSGTNFQSIVNATKKGELQATIKVLFCDKKEAKVIERAKAEGIPAIVLTPKEFPSKKEYEEAILTQLKELQVDWIILAGYMRLIGETLLHAYEGNIVNIHPSLLPAFPGKDAIQQAFQAKVKITGVTVHFVDEGMDTGPIIDQESIRIDEHETYESLQAKIQRIEHVLYPKTIQALVTRGHHS
ncbi:phosphoribosylglycinamide formyltransferase [Bacillus suaedaesalsae]|uniref:Phosphoribosylglycinamide formyltransferase n=1 Tax=Bacillus suaedaesalsae TaxID=2810349 RepID=A0ABS2DF72_9BACI|nr:phosphoribosylglycinamide formyltransferase [Bacillus suaedaesalsae]MBM6616243.1 phosphoribosylglycinamide formyltransferase [Bacillus suaedaesalsae]